MRVTVCVLLLVVVEMVTCQQEEQGETRLLSNQNTAALTGAALGLGIGVAGSLLVGKLVEDTKRCAPPPRLPFLPELPDLLQLRAHCRGGERYRGVQAGYPSPSQTVPSPSSNYPSPGYTIPRHLFTVMPSII